MFPFNRNRLSVVYLVFASTLKLAGTVIVTAPKDVDAVLGTPVIFNCSSSLPQTDVQWVHYPIEKSMQVIYAFGRLYSGIADRFTVENGHNLHISSITVDDAGTYECQDDYGQGERRSAELIVLESNPMCQSSSNLSEVIENNTRRIEPNQLTLSCVIQYQGKKAPILEWRKTGDDWRLTTGVSYEIRGNVVVNNLTIKGDSIVNGSSYNCRPGKAASEATSCNSGAIIVIGEPVASTHQSESCQIYMYAMIFFTIVGSVITIAINAFVAGVVWHLFIDVQNQSSIEVQGPNANESKNLLNNEREAMELESNTESGARVKTSSSNVHVAQQKSTKAGSKSKGMFSTDAKIFVSAMAVPLCIGLLLWYLIAYRQAKRKKKKGQGGNGQLATFLNQQHKMEEMQENINNLKSDGKNKQQTIEGLKGELEEARVNLTKDAANDKELEKLLLAESQRKLEDAQEKLDDAQKKWDVERKALDDENKLLWNQLDDLKKNTKAEEKYNITNVQEKIQIETSKFPQKPIKSFALLNNEVYIFFQREVEKDVDVEIFDATSWKQTRRLKMKDVTNPEDAVACVRKRCIYVSDGGRIFRIDSDINHLNDWQTESAEIRLSVSRDSTVIVTMCDKRKIKEFSSEGKILGEFDLQKVDVSNPVHAIKIRKDVFIVIHGKSNDAIGLHRVCEVSFSSYQILKSFGSIQGRGNTQLTNPKHLAIDHNGSIFVADAGNARIVVLGSNLAFKREEFSEKDPTTVLLDEINSRLYI